MRSHFAESAVAVATFVAAYLLFDNQQNLTSLSANQVESIQAAFEGKSDRLAVKEDEEVEEQVFSPKIVRLEKYSRPAEGDLNSPEWKLKSTFVSRRLRLFRSPTRQETSGYRSRRAKGYSNRNARRGNQASI